MTIHTVPKPVIASGHTIIKHLLAKYGPLTHEELLARVPQFEPMKNVSRSHLKRYYLKALKDRGEIRTKIDRSKPHPRSANRFQFVHVIAPDLLERYKSDRVLEFNTGALTEEKNKELELSRRFWHGETSEPHIPQWPGKKEGDIPSS
ncbi:hypothetical protein H4R35_006581 [Dimargaris xerosporica]|nr:hypothetical protein H4R35_006581 [Dimargaris xerosporica]